MAEQEQPVHGIDDEMNEIREYIDTIDNQPGSDQARIAKETLIYKYHIQIARMNHLIAQQQRSPRVLSPIRPPDVDRQQQLEREIMELQANLDKTNRDHKELMDVNQQWNNQYHQMITRATEEKQQLDNKIKEQASRIEFLSTIKPTDIPSDDALSQLNEEKEELQKSVQNANNDNTKLKKKVERLKTLLDEDENSAEILHKKVSDMVTDNKKLREDEKKNINEYKLMQDKCTYATKDLEELKKKEKETADKLKKVTEEKDKLKDDLTSSKQDYKALQAKVIIGLLGTEKDKKDDKVDKKKKKKVQLYSMSHKPPYYAYDDEFLDPHYEPASFKSKLHKHRRSFPQKLSDWDKNFETLDYPYFPNPHRKEYFAVDSD